MAEATWMGRAGTMWRLRRDRQGIPRAVPVAWWPINWAWAIALLPVFAIAVPVLFAYYLVRFSILRVSGR